MFYLAADYWRDSQSAYVQRFTPIYKNVQQLVPEAAPKPQDAVNRLEMTAANRHLGAVVIRDSKLAKRVDSKED
jgi:hypothetical protein